jgi:hypothetical protein
MVASAHCNQEVRAMLPFHIYDVFTSTPFTGNPLAIVEDADGLSTAQMQTIARQFNLSETIFVQTPDDPAHTAKVRIFFPTAEIPFAGHPTIGCAIHLAGDTQIASRWRRSRASCPSRSRTTAPRRWRSSPPPSSPARSRPRPTAPPWPRPSDWTEADLAPTPSAISRAAPASSTWR